MAHFWSLPFLLGGSDITPPLRWLRRHRRYACSELLAHRLGSTQVPGQSGSSGACGPERQAQIGTVALGWPLQLSWPLPHHGQSGRSLKEVSMQGLQPWTLSSVGGSSGARETHRGSFVNRSGDGSLGRGDTGWEEGEGASSEPL